MKTHIYKIPQNQKSNRVILEFSVQIPPNQQLFSAETQQPWEGSRASVTGSTWRCPLSYLYRQKERLLSSRCNLVGHKSHTRDSRQHSCEGQQAATLFFSQEHTLLSAWEQWSIDVNVPQSENRNINIKKSNRTKFLELHIKTELLQLKQQIKISAEVFW